jgi:peptidoglycan pentaglycine glycine transferase (the first glycine)
MFTINKIAETDSDVFNKYIISSPYSSIYQTFEWGEIKKTDGWDVIRFIIRDNEEIIGAFSALTKKVPLLNIVYMYIPRGPVVDYNSSKKPAVLKFVIDYLKEYCKKNNIVYVRINPDLPYNEDNKNLLESLGLKKSNNPILHTATFRLNLLDSEEQILKNFESRIRHDIKKAETQEVKIINSNDLSNFNIFYDLLNTVSEKNKFPIYSYKLMKTIWEVLSEKNMCRIFITEYNGVFLSGAFLLLAGKKCIYQWGGSIRSEMKINPNQFMHWEIIKWLKNNHYTSYDFQGVKENVEKGDPLWGIYLFKRGFSGDYVKLVGEYDLVVSEYLYSIIVKAEPYYPKLKILLNKIIK